MTILGRDVNFVWVELHAFRCPPGLPQSFFWGRQPSEYLVTLSMWGSKVSFLGGGAHPSSDAVRSSAGRGLTPDLLTPGRAC